MTSKGTVRAEKKSGNAGNTSGKDGETIDLRTETTATSRNTPHPTFGSTTMDTTEEQRIHTIVCRVMEEKYGQGRAALRQHLGLAPEDPKISKESVAPSVPVGTEVPRTSFGSPLSIDGVSPSVPSVSTGSQPFATAAWKPKEPPCFFGRSTEDAHTWVSLVRNYLTFMSGSDSQQVAYTVTLFRDAAHEWYMSYERRNRGPPRDWAGLVAALLDRFGSNIRSQEAQSQLMSISQGNRAVRDYASQFETLLGRLDSYDEGLMLNQFIWGLQPDLARSVSLHYPNTIAKAVSLAETTELAVRASRRPGTKWVQVEIRQKAPVNKIGGKANGNGVEVTEVEDVAEVQWGRLGVIPEAEEDVDVVTLLTMIRWLVTGAGCVAIWHATVPKNLYKHREVAMLALPEGHSHNPGKKAHEAEDVVAKFDLGASMYCMMRTGMLFPWTMQVNCTSPSNMNKLLAM